MAIAATVHKHRCGKCDTVWEHGAGCQGSTPAHICPTPGCGQEEREWYEGDKSAAYVTDCATKQHTAVADAAVRNQPDFDVMVARIRAAGTQVENTTTTKKGSTIK